ncbi:MAG: carboxypeptidase regulatory-like domain-containing protein [Acidobacteria bacterium]|nr:carboxypeptidase regulatory-like domain-containing protein [Acidobacteriota bacterium]
MKKKVSFGLVALLAVWAGARLPLQAASDTPGVVLAGSVRSASGQNLGGVAVSARAEGKTYTTTVFTDEQGQYLFPALEKGTYQLWAQTVGFETAWAEPKLEGSQPLRQDFALQPTADFSRQLSGTEWMAALPDDTVENRRLKRLFRNNCAGCHQPNFVLLNRFDEAGWLKIINVMERVGIYGEPPRTDGAPLPLIRYYKEELAAYLAKMRGPGPSPMKFKPFPRPRGEAAQVVITEYDVTSNSDPAEYPAADGSNWEEGEPSAYESRGVHDAEVDPSGLVWIADSQSNTARTVARLDPRTGEVKNYKLPGRYGNAKVSHGLVIDSKGIAWFNADGGLGKIDTKTEKIEFFEPPQDMARVGGTLDADANGMIWMSTNEGALKFDPTTNKFAAYPSKSRGSIGRTYGIAVDAEGNGWWAQMNYDKLGVGNGRTGEITEVALPPISGLDDILTANDRRVQQFIRSDWNSATAWHQGPRRLGADKKGNTVWVADSWGDTLAKIDTKTHKVTTYPYPSPGYGLVYDTVIDKNGMVWINLMNADRVARFNPKTETWTEFTLPSIATENRFIAVDNSKDTVEVWVPYWRTNRLARIQFRSKEQLRAQR